MARKTLTEARNAAHYWGFILRKALRASMGTWILLFVVASLPQVLAYILTRLQVPATEASAFIPPNYVLSLGVLLAAILLFRLVTIPPGIHRDLDAQASKHTWTDVAVDLIQSGPHSPHGLSIRVHNAKSFPLEIVEVVVAHIQVDRSPMPGAQGILPYSLAWIEGDSLAWHALTVPPGDDARAALANTNKRMASAFYVTPNNFGIAINATTDHLVRIEVRGHVNSCPLPPLNKTVHLRFDGAQLAADFFESVEPGQADNLC